jgi:hypothetical protein
MGKDLGGIANEEEVELFVVADDELTDLEAFLPGDGSLLPEDDVPVDPLESTNPLDAPPGFDGLPFIPDEPVEVEPIAKAKKPKAKNAPKKQTVESREADEMLPSGLSIQFSHMQDDGVIGHSGLVAISVVKKSKTVEAYVEEFLVPKFGWGRYYIYLITPLGKRSYRGSVTIPMPMDEGDEMSDALLRQLMGRLDVIEGALKPKTTSPAPMDTGAMMIEMLRGGQKKGIDMGEIMGFMMVQQMMREMSAQARADQERDNPKRPDETAILLRAMMEELGKKKDVPAPAPVKDILADLDRLSPTPPQQQFGPKEMTELIGNIMNIARPPQTTSTDLSEILKVIVPRGDDASTRIMERMVDTIEKTRNDAASQSMNALTSRMEEIGRLVTMGQSGNGQNIPSLIENLRAARELAGELDRGDSAPGTNVMDLLSELAKSAPAIMGMLNNPQVPPATQQIPAQVHEIADQSAYDEGGFQPEPVQEQMSAADAAQMMKSATVDNMQATVDLILRSFLSHPQIGDMIREELTGDPDRDKSTMIEQLGGVLEFGGLTSKEAAVILETVRNSNLDLRWISEELAATSP